LTSDKSLQKIFDAASNFRSTRPASPAEEANSQQRMGRVNLS